MATGIVTPGPEEPGLARTGLQASVAYTDHRVDGTGEIHDVRALLDDLRILNECTDSLKGSESKLIITEPLPAIARSDSTILSPVLEANPGWVFRIRVTLIKRNECLDIIAGKGDASKLTELLEAETGFFEEQNREILIVYQELFGDLWERFKIFLEAVELELSTNAQIPIRLRLDDSNVIRLISNAA